MFSIIRFILVVGVIFYFSPVRQGGEGTAALDAWLSPKKGEAAAPSPAPTESHAGHLETVWQALPNGAKQAVIDKILTTSGLGASDAKASDTLQSGDRQPHWRGEPQKPRS